jgi:hypothetical protein
VSVGGRRTHAAGGGGMGLRGRLGEARAGGRMSERGTGGRTHAAGGGGMELRGCSAERGREAG